MWDLWEEEPHLRRSILVASIMPQGVSFGRRHLLCGNEGRIARRSSMAKSGSAGLFIEYKYPIYPKSISILTMSSSASPDLSSIPVVVIGWGRENGIIFIPRVFKEHNTSYVMTAMVDFVETLEPYRYSPKNLGVILHNLHPRPRALIIGIAISPSLVPEITDVWNEYVNTVLKEEFKENDEWKKNVCSPLPLTHYVDPSVGKPPIDIGWEIEMFKHLDGVFRPEITWE